MEIDSDEIAAYVRAVLQGISQGVTSGYSLSSPVKFQLGLSNVSEKEGGIKVMIARIGGSKASQENARIEFEIDDSFNVGLKAFSELQKANPARFLQNKKGN